VPEEAAEDGHAVRCGQGRVQLCGNNRAILDVASQNELINYKRKNYDIERLENETAIPTDLLCNPGIGRLSAVAARRE
jgi:hypothetical protein